MKDSKTIDVVAQRFLDQLEDYAKRHGQTKNIQYVIYQVDNVYHIKIEKDEENILQSFLDGMDE